jgi:hypothetical protein
MPKSRKNIPWKGWSKVKPRTHQRTIMFNKCGKKCFLGPKKSFPICNKNTCKVNFKGVYAAYVRARQFRSRNSTYKNISVKANKLLKKMGVKR